MPYLYADTRDNGVMTIKLLPFAGNAGPNIAVIAPDGDYLALSISNNAIKDRHKVLEHRTLSNLINAGWTDLSLHDGRHLPLPGQGTGWCCGNSGFLKLLNEPKITVSDSSGKISLSCSSAYNAALNALSAILAGDDFGKKFTVVRQVYHKLEYDRH